MGSGGARVTPHAKKSMGRATGEDRDSTARLRRARKGVRMLTFYSVRYEAAEVLPKLLARANAAAC